MYQLINTLENEIKWINKKVQKKNLIHKRTYYLSKNTL